MKDNLPISYSYLTLLLFLYMFYINYNCYVSYMNLYTVQILIFENSYFVLQLISKLPIQYHIVLLIYLHQTSDPCKVSNIDVTVEHKMYIFSGFCIVSIPFRLCLSISLILFVCRCKKKGVCITLIKLN